MNQLRGVAGTLLPGRFLVEALAESGPHDRDDNAQLARRLPAWWASIDAHCGPTTATRSLFDLVAMPLFGMLGFRAHQCAFEQDCASGWLETHRGTAVAFLLRPWGTRPQACTSELTEIARAFSASWGFVLAPPFLSLVDMRGHATRRALDFTLPEVLRGSELALFITLTSNCAFDRDAAGAAAPIERTVERAIHYQDRVRQDLQHGVLSALDSWTSAIRHAARLQGHRSRRAASNASVPAPRDQALTLVYRVLFLLFAESRGLVPHDQPLYHAAYAMSTLCRASMANDTVGGWDGLAAATRLARLGCGSRDLVVAPFNGPLFARSSAPALEGGRPSTRSSRPTEAEAATQRALVALASRPGRAGRETISFRDLGVEQLGAVYERVLDVLPSEATPLASGRRRHSDVRKQSGTFYTPQALTDFIVRRTLAPLVRGAAPERILALRVLDPAMGSGAFLVAACHYLAGAYERAMIEDGRAAITDIDDEARAGFRRLVAEQCLAGVDVNTRAVQLARLSLWLTTLARGKPLSFLDHRLRIGNSLLGAWPDDVRQVADRPTRQARGLPLLETDDLALTMQQVVRPLGILLAQRDDSVRDIHRKEAMWQALSSAASPLASWRRALDCWCARWFWPGTAEPAPGAPEMRALLAALLSRDASLPATRLAERLHATALAAERHVFFHWPLEFADVFYDAYGQPRQAPGFDAVVGNPPWEMLRTDPREAGAASGTARDNRSIIRFIRESGAYPSCGRGHLNLYQPFLERSLALTRPGGRYGLVLPWGLAADDGATHLRSRLLDRTSLDTLVGVDNARDLFPIHRGMRFAVIAGTANATTVETEAICGVRNTDELEALPGLRTPARAHGSIRLTPSDVAALGGSARRLPDLRDAADVAWRLRVTRQCPRLGERDGWNLSFGRELNATEARPYFSDAGFRVLEGKHIDAFTIATPAETRRISDVHARRLLPGRPFTRPRLAYRDVSAVGNRATLIAAVVPAGVVTSHTLFCLRTPLPLTQQYYLCGIFNSFVASALVRVVMAGHVTTSIIESLPVPGWTDHRPCRLIAGIARRLSGGLPSPLARARLQALVASLYGLSVEEFRGILRTFPLVPVGERDRAAAILANLTA